MEELIIPDILDIDITPPKWLWPNFIAEGCLHIIAGEPGAMKSMLALSFACGKSSGKLWSTDVEKSQVIYVDRENPKVIARGRCEQFGLTKPHSLCYWGLFSPIEPPLIVDPVYSMLAEKDKPIFIFDSLIRFHKGDENEATDMAQAMTCFRNLCAKGATVLILHHKGKEKFEGPTPSYRGSSEILGAVDIAFALSKKDKDNHVELDLKGIKNRFDETKDLKFVFNKDTKQVIATELPVLNNDEDMIYSKLNGMEPMKASHIGLLTGFSEGKVRAILKGWEGKLFKQVEGPNKSILWTTA